MALRSAIYSPCSIMACVQQLPGNGDPGTVLLCNTIHTGTPGQRLVGPTTKTYCGILIVSRKLLGLSIRFVA
jgi:hypothetical protein